MDNLAQSSSSDRMLWVVRVAWGISGLLWFIWLSYEDRSLTSVMLVAAAILMAASLTIFYRSIWQRDLPGSRGFFWIALLGLVAGLSMSLLTVGLLVVKISLHNHSVPDFSVLDMVSVLSRIPIWGIVGLLSGVSFGWMYATKKR